MAGSGEAGVGVSREEVGGCEVDGEKPGEAGEEGDDREVIGDEVGDDAPLGEVWVWGWSAGHFGRNLFYKSG